jgi:hypothetical protein
MRLSTRSAPGPRVQNFDPHLLMLGREQQEVRRLLARLAVQRERVAHLLATADIDAENARAWRLRQRLRELAASVLRRELGVDREAVIDVMRDDGASATMQLVEVDVMDGSALAPGWRWALEGHALGETRPRAVVSSTFTLSSGRMRMRDGDGTWHVVVPRLRCRIR